MQIREKLPEACERQVAAEPLFSGKTDVDEEGRFGVRWLVVTEGEALVLGEDGTVHRQLALTSISDARALTAIGGGSLAADTEDGPIVLIRFTAAHAGKFQFAAKLIAAAAKGEELPSASDKDVPRTCGKCGSSLPEGTNVCPVCVDKGKVVGRLLRYARPYRVQMTVAAVMLIFATLMELVPPFLTKIIVDNVLQPKDMGYALLFFVLGLGLTRLLLSVMQTLRGYLGVWVGSKLMNDIRRDIYNALMGLSLGFFDRRQTAQFIGRVNSDSEAMRQFLTDGVIWVTGQVMMLIAIMSMMLSLNWQLALLVLIPTPLVFIASVTIWPFTRRRWYRQWRAINKLNMVVGDALQGIRVVKAFGQEKAERDRYDQSNGEVMRQTIQVEGMWQGVFPFFSLITGSGALLVWYYGGKSVIHDEITLGTLMAFISYLGMFFGPLQWFSQAMNWTSRALTAADRVFEIIDTPSEVPNAPNAVRLDGMKGEVVFETVSYGYEKHHPVLKDVSLSVAAGEMVGLVGHSGAGKSTMINLICRFYDPDQGRILMDGVDLREIDQETLRSQIGVVLQETFLFDGTIAENIAYSKPDATPLEIMRAAKIANAHDFIVRMPDGYDTRVGERGHRLSGGEKQRIAIARAIVHDPRVLILDEATASVDTETERQIQEAISRLIQGRTTFAIAHRLSTLRGANRLIVLDKGKVAEIGTHDELLDQEGIYYKLVQAQQELSKIRGVEG